MASLKLSDSAFGTLGLTITEAIDLADIGQQLSSLLGMAFSFESLDVSAVTRTGLSATGIGVPGGTLTVGDYFNFVADAPVSGFSNIALTQATIDAHGSAFEIRSGGQLFASDGADFGFDFGSDVSVVDFSGAGAAAVATEIVGIASFDDGSVLYGGFEVIGNEADNLFEGYAPFSDLPYYGSNVLRGAGGNDGILGGLGQELLEGGAGDDTVLGMLYVSSNFSDAVDYGDVLYGDLESPDPTVAGGNDLLFGGLGDDTVDGGAGDDLIYASDGLDRLTGGTGRDRFIIADDTFVQSDLLVPDGEGGQQFLSFYTGFSVSFVEAPNTITDFAPGEDLLVLQLDESQLSDLTFTDTDAFVLTFDPNNNNETDIGLFAAAGNNPVSVGIVDSLNQLRDSNIVVRADMGFGDSFMALSFEWTPEDPTLGPVSLEIVYDAVSDSANFGDGLLYDEFTGLQLTPFAQSNVQAGQDKFDFTGFGLGEPGSSAIEDILFTSPGGDYGGFTFENFQFDSGLDPVAEFFFDTEAQVDRAVNVEWDPLSGAIAVFVDANTDGDFHPLDDLLFTVDGLLDGNGFFYGGDGGQVLTKEDLYADAGGDGSGTGIFIFNDDQYDLWFNDTAPPEVIG